MTFNAFTVYAKEKRMCHTQICSFIFVSLVIFIVLCIEADMLYVHRIELKEEMKADCEDKTGILSRLDGY
jgi:hypothetical protein